MFKVGGHLQYRIAKCHYPQLVFNKKKSIMQKVVSKKCAAVSKTIVRIVIIIKQSWAKVWVSGRKSGSRWRTIPIPKAPPQMDGRCRRRHSIPRRHDPDAPDRSVGRLYVPLIYDNLMYSRQAWSSIKLFGDHIIWDRILREMMLLF